ncbi:MAG TPA: SDR family oxidoreductase [Allosphingosinicella sp.]|nr:SDR family oxidoreductase [Allosphingosinicella sp.]
MAPAPVTLVTGASSGLGAEFARQCRARGDRLVLVARRRDRLDALAAELGQTHVVALDLAEPDAPERLAAEMEALGLTVETLVNNAGFGLSGRFAGQPAARQTGMIDLNVRALTALCRHFLPPMLERRRGFLLNIASTAAFQAGPNMAVYYASKAYVLSLTEALHQETKGKGVHVTALCPGPIATEFFEVAGAADGRLAKLGADPAAIASAGLHGLARNRAIVIPGFMNKVTAQSNRLLPRAAMRRIVAAIKA